MDQSKVIDKLNEILRWEWTGLSQYAHYSYMVRGLWREVYSEMFKDSAEECFSHANKVADKIVALGGVPTIEREKVQKTDDLQEMLDSSLQFEQQAVDHYNEALKLAEGDRPLVVLLEDLILEEQEGVDDLTKLLREYKAAAGTGPEAKSKSA